MVDIIGYIAAVLTTVAFIPQVIKVIKTKNTRDISLLMYIIFITGIACWEIYGILKSDLPIIIANLITLILASIILIQKIKG